MSAVCDVGALYSNTKFVWNTNEIQSNVTHAHWNLKHDIECMSRDSSNKCSCCCYWCCCWYIFPFYRVMLQSFIYYVYHVILWGSNFAPIFSVTYIRGFTKYLIYFFQDRMNCFAHNKGKKSQLHTAQMDEILFLND